MKPQRLLLMPLPPNPEVWSAGHNHANKITCTNFCPMYFKPLERLMPPTPEPSTPVRIRSHDKMADSAVVKARLQACRRIIVVGDTTFRCEVKTHLPNNTGAQDHCETGIIVRGSGAPTDAEYTITWREVPKRQIRKA